MDVRWAIYWTIFSLDFCHLQVLKDDPASKQLFYYAKEHTHHQTYIVSDAGQPVDSITSSLTIGRHGPMLLQDSLYIENMARFNRERIPERVVHGKGAGAFGYFEVTHDITKYCKARVFEKIGKRTPIAVRFSFVTGEHGTADTIRDPRGFAIKFRTEDGIWDLVGNNTPIFFMRDPSLFPLFIHSQKRNPQTNLRDYNMYWDFITKRPETVHQVMVMFSDNGIPDGYRFMHGYGSHTFKVVNKDNVPYYVKFHYRTDQGIRNLSPEKAANLSAVDPDYATRDLFDAIAKEDYPSWTFYIQVMTHEEAENYRWNPFDVTKVLWEEDFPLIPVGKIVLNQNPINYFTDVEQIAFSPSNFVPGIEASVDKMLQGRLFAYADSHRYRLGTNYLQLPVNSPHLPLGVSNFNRDGDQVYYNQYDAPNYYPNSFRGPEEVPSAAISAFNVTGEVKRYDTGDEDNYSQPAILWNNVLKSDERARMVKNIADHVRYAAKFLQIRAVKLFANVSPDMGLMLARKLQIDPAVFRNIKIKKGEFSKTKQNKIIDYV